MSEFKILCLALKFIQAKTNGTKTQWFRQPQTADHIKMQNVVSDRQK